MIAALVLLVMAPAILPEAALSPTDRAIWEKANDHIGWLGNLVNLGFGPDGGRAFDNAYGNVRVHTETGKITTVRKFYKTAFFSQDLTVLDYKCMKLLRSTDQQVKVSCGFNFERKGGHDHRSRRLDLNFVEGSLKSIDFFEVGHAVNG